MSVAEALSPMALCRRILSSKTINCTDCIHDCHPSAFPSPPSLSSGESSSSGRRVFSNAVLGSVSSAAGAAFLILTYYIVLVRRRRVDGRLPSSVNISASEAEDADADYHVWRIPTFGFDESTIKSIVVKPYIVPAGGGSADCSVCLLELREGELVRRLSFCAHAFHVPCIDTWLRAHISCPLCRASIVVPCNPVAPEGNVLISDRRVSGNLEEVGEREVRTLAVADSILRARSDLLGNGLQSEWRSSPKNSSAGSDLFHSVDGDERFVEEEKKGLEHYCSDEDMSGVKRGKRGSSSKGDCPQKSSTEIGGGSSSGSRRTFFPRCGRARSSTFLPL